MKMSSFFQLVSADIYNIVSERGSVGHFCLFKSAYRIGEEIVGSFDFSNSLIICLKVNTAVTSFKTLNLMAQLKRKTIHNVIFCPQTKRLDP